MTPPKRLPARERIVSMSFCCKPSEKKLIDECARRAGLNRSQYIIRQLKLINPLTTQE